MIFKKEKKKSIEEIFKDRCKDLIESNDFDAKSKLSSDQFSSVMYKNCKFNRVIFNKIIFQDVVFINCTFFGCKFELCSNFFDGHTVFDQCFIHLSNFIQCSLSTTWICDSRIKGVKFKNTVINDSLFHENCYYSVSFIDNCDLSSTIFLRSSGWLDISFTNENSFVKMDSKTKIKYFNYKDLHHTEGKGKKVYVFDATMEENVANTFINFANQFLKNDLTGNYGECLYDSKIALHKSLKWYKKPGSILLKFICGYGEKWTNGIIFSLFYIIFNAVVYMMNGLETSDGKIINYDFVVNFKNQIFNYTKLKDFGECLYFSMMTFTTVGYGNSQAMGFVSRLFSFFEMYFGILITALITGTILRRLFR
jgi:hypothetical protein